MNSHKGMEQDLVCDECYVGVSRCNNPLSSNTRLGSVYFQKSLGVKPRLGLVPLEH